MQSTGPNADDQKGTRMTGFGCESDMRIKCPKCGADIRVNESVAELLTGAVRQDYERRMKEGVESAAKSAEERVTAQLQQERLEIALQEANRIKAALKPELDEEKRKVASLQEALNERDTRLTETEKNEAEALKRARALESEKRDFDLAVQRGIDEAMVREREMGRREGAEAADRKAGELQDVIRDMEKKLAEAHDAQADVMREKRELAEETGRLKLSVEQRVEEQLDAVRSQSRKDVESLELQLSEKDMKIKAMAKTLEEARQQARQGSEQTQGDVQEVALDEVLRMSFPQDRVERVPKGELGGDILQHVMDAAKHECGTIVWESKRTKRWSDDWLKKLHRDQQAAGADVAALVTQTLPEGITSFGLVDDVWVMRLDTAIAVAVALRDLLLKVALVRQATTGGEEKARAMYEYLTGPACYRQIKAIVDAFAGMQHDLDQEMQVMTKHWAQRGMEITRVMQSVAGLCGDLQGIAGSEILQIDALNIRALDAAPKVPMASGEVDNSSQKASDEAAPPAG